MRNLTNINFKRIASISILILILILFYNLSKQIFDSLQINYRLDEETDKLTKLQQEYNGLKRELQKVESIGFIESQARDKLNMGRDGEVVMIIPDTEITKVLQRDKKEEEEKIPNWQGWLNLFWH